MAADALKDISSRSSGAAEQAAELERIQQEDEEAALQARMEEEWKAANLISSHVHKVAWSL